MISFLRGTIAALFVDSVVMEVGGIGYRVSMSGKSLSRLGHVGEEVKVLTRLQVRDDALVLYGFLNHDEEKLFAKLTSVSSVGPKVALSALSTTSQRRWSPLLCRKMWGLSSKFLAWERKWHRALRSN